MYMIKTANHINYLYTPSPFLERHLVVSDNIGFWASKDFYYNREAIKDYLLLYVLQGTFYVEQYGKKHTLKAGDAILMRLTDAHIYYSDKTDVAHIIWAHFWGDTIAPIMDTLYSNNCLPIISPDEQVRNCIQECMKIAATQTVNFEYPISSLLYSTILHFSKPWMVRIQNQAFLEDSWFTDPVNRYIDEHIYEKITLDQLCNTVSMSKGYFCKTFKKYFSLSPLQYAMKKKIIMSEYLLSNSDQGLETIAHSLGFSDQSHFCKTFKAWVGTTPLRYRNGKKI